MRLFKARILAPMAVTVGLLIVMTQFQNCSTVSPDGAHTLRSAPDHFAAADLKFAQPRVIAMDDAADVELIGECSKNRNGSKLTWSLLNDNVVDAPLDKGDTVCENGHFRFAVQVSDDMICGLDHLILVKSEWGATIQTSLSKRCQPLAFKKISRECALDYNLKSDSPGERVCTKVCSERGRLISEEKRPQEECQGLASTLAGH